MSVNFQSTCPCVENIGGIQDKEQELKAQINMFSIERNAFRD